MVALVTAVLCATLAVAGFYAVQRFFPSLRHDANNEMVRICSGLASGLYSLLLAFVVVTEVVPSVVELRGGGRVSEFSQTVGRATSGAAVVVLV
jgi:hypothetical protein